MSKGNKAVQTYGLYDATFKRTSTPGTTVQQQPWSGKLPSNKSSGGPNKFKKVR